MDAHLTSVHSRLANAWDKLRSSFWFVPLLMSVSAVALSWLTIQIDLSYNQHGFTTMGWIAAGNPEEARESLSTIAGAVATIAGVVFSITMVVLTLASAQFGPRVLRQFMRDGWTQGALGTFIATFAFCILVLGAMGPLQEKGAVLDVSVSVAILLGLVSLGVLVLFLHHVSANIQAANVVARLNCELEDVVAANYPLHDGERPERSGSHSEFDCADCAEVGWDDTSAYVQAISYSDLVKLATKHDLQMKLLRRPGQFLISGEPVAEVRPAHRVTAQLASAICGAFEAGAQRTQSQDVEFGIDQMVQVALRALSPSLNDAATANICIDHLASAICYIAPRQLDGHLEDKNGIARVFTKQVTFAGLLDAAFNEIRQNAGEQVSVNIRLLENLGRIARFARTDEQRNAVIEQLELVLAAADRPHFAERDRRDILDRYRKACAALNLPVDHLRKRDTKAA